MTRIYLIRHAEAEGNIFQFSQGRYDAPLTEWGWKQVAALEDRFRDVHLDRVYSSSLYRARATASALYKPKNLPLDIDDGLIEMDMGDRDVLPVSIWGEIDHDQLVAFFDNEYEYDEKYVPKGGEKFCDIAERLRVTLIKLAKENDGKTLGIVSHGAITRVFYAKYYGKTQLEVPYAANTSVSLLEVEGENIKIVELSDASHLIKAGLNNSLGIQYKETVDEMTAALIVERKAPGDDSNWKARQFQKDAGYMKLDIERDKDEKIGHIEEVYLKPEFRGKKLAKAFIGRAIIVYRELKRDYLQVFVEPDNKLANDLFRRYDFNECGKTPDGKIILRRHIGYKPF